MSDLRKMLEAFHAHRRELVGSRRVLLISQAPRWVSTVFPKNEPFRARFT